MIDVQQKKGFPKKRVAKPHQVQFRLTEEDEDMILELKERCKFPSKSSAVYYIWRMQMLSLQEDQDKVKQGQEMLFDLLRQTTDEPEQATLFDPIVDRLQEKLEELVSTEVKKEIQEYAEGSIAQQLESLKEDTPS